jgi:hypothetical protein
MSQMLHGEPDLSRLPSALAGPVASCLERDPGARPSVSALLNRFTSDGQAPDQWLPDAVSNMVTELAAATEPHQDAATATGPVSAPQPVPPAGPWRPSRRLVLGAVAAVAAIGLVVGGVATVLALTGDEAPPEFAQGGGGGDAGAGTGSEEQHTIVLEADYESPDAEGLPLGVSYYGFLPDSNTLVFADENSTASADAGSSEPVEVQTPWSETIEFEGTLDSFMLSVYSGQPITSDLDFTCRITLDGEVLLEVTNGIGSMMCGAHGLGGEPIVFSAGDTCYGTLIRNPPSCDD